MNRDSAKQSLNGPSIWTRSLLIRTVPLLFREIDGTDIVSRFYAVLFATLANRVCEEGFVRAENFQIVNYSGGQIRGEYVDYEVAFYADVFVPSEQLRVNCVCFDVNSAGIGAASTTSPTPFIVTVVRDPYAKVDLLSSIQKGTKFQAEVVSFQSVIGNQFITMNAVPVRLL